MTRNANPARGERIATAKLTADAIREIRSTFRRSDRRFGASALARRYGVSRDTIACVVARKTWRHVR